VEDELTTDHALPLLLRLVVSLSLLTLAGCSGLPYPFLVGVESDLKEANHAIQTARGDVELAKAYSSRGVAYSEKARFSRGQKIISNEEYESLFGLAMKDHNRAVTLNPASTDVYFNRAQTNYDRGWGDLEENKTTSKPWFDAAAIDFEKALEKDPKNSLALDRLGLAYEQGDQPDKAIEAYTREMAFDRRLGRMRLADAYCDIGFQHQQKNQYPEAAAAYWKSIEFDGADDKSCKVNPFDSIVWIYTTQTREFDKAWEVVQRAQNISRRISSEVLDQLKKKSERDN
jgi:tetratricopeptide (TPR) repeat protein